MLGEPLDKAIPVAIAIANRVHDLKARIRESFSDRGQLQQDFNLFKNTPAPDVTRDEPLLPIDFISDIFSYQPWARKADIIIVPSRGCILFSSQHRR
jgi:hypothetical protein